MQLDRPGAGAEFEDLVPMLRVRGRGPVRVGRLAPRRYSRTWCWPWCSTATMCRSGRRRARDRGRRDASPAATAAPLQLATIWISAGRARSSRALCRTAARHNSTTAPIRPGLDLEHSVQSDRQSIEVTGLSRGVLGGWSTFAIQFVVATKPPTRFGDTMFDTPIGIATQDSNLNAQQVITFLLVVAVLRLLGMIGQAWNWHYTEPAKVPAPRPRKRRTRRT